MSGTARFCLLACILTADYGDGYLLQLIVFHFLKLSIRKAEQMYGEMRSIYDAVENSRWTFHPQCPKQKCRDIFDDV